MNVSVLAPFGSIELMAGNHGRQDVGFAFSERALADTPDDRLGAIWVHEVHAETRIRATQQHVRSDGYQH